VQVRKKVDGNSSFTFQSLLRLVHAFYVNDRKNASPVELHVPTEIHDAHKCGGWERGRRGREGGGRMSGHTNSKSKPT
jgi:hypothetical protein